MKNWTVVTLVVSVLIAFPVAAKSEADDPAVSLGQENLTLPELRALNRIDLIERLTREDLIRLQAEQAKLLNRVQADLNQSQSDIEKTSQELLESAYHLSKEDFDLAVSRVAPVVEALQPRMDLLEARVADNLAYHVWPRQGFIGIHLGDVSDEGVTIRSVMEGGPAEEAGLEANDVIVSVGGVQLKDVDNPDRVLIALLGSSDPGTSIRIGAVRSGKTEDYEVIVGARNGTVTITHDANNPATYVLRGSDAPSVGITAIPSTDQWILDSESVIRGTTLTQQISDWQRKRDSTRLVLLEFERDMGHYFDMEFGVLVIDAPEGRALKKGDVLLRINDKAVRSISHAQRYFEASDGAAKVEIKRRNKKQEIELVSNDLIVRDVLQR